MTRKQRRQVINTIVIVLAILLVLQLQPFVIRARQGVGGSFGYHPYSDDCLGWVGPADSVSWLPFGDLEFQLGYFNFHYSFTRAGFEEAMQMCMGQDIVYGE